VRTGERALILAMDGVLQTLWPADLLRRFPRQRLE
jgi:hypothetical protein